MNFDEMSVEEIVNCIQGGTFLTIEEIETVLNGRILQNKDNDLMGAAWKKLKSLDDDGELPVEIDIEDIRDQMYEYASDNGLEFSPSHGQFWKASTC